MATILTHGNSEGERRCDGKCHHATGPKCNCICGGRYHGLGDKARDQLTTDFLGDDWRERLLGEILEGATPVLRQSEMFDG